MVKVGITGGIGSGKSTVCKVFETLGIPVYYSDLESRTLTNSHHGIISGVKQLFGNDIYIEGELNRKKVGEIVFNNKKLLHQLNQIIHPIVAEHFNYWLNQNRGADYILKEAAILFESGAYKQVDKIITVTAPEELRIKRVIQRDKVNRNDVISKIKNQLDDNNRILKSDYLIKCDDVMLVIPQVIEIHKDLIKDICKNR